MPPERVAEGAESKGVDRRQYVADDGTPEIERRFTGGFPARSGIEVIRWALGEPWTSNWRVLSLARQGNAAVVVLRHIEGTDR